MTSEVDKQPSATPPPRERKNPYLTIKKLLVPKTLLLLRVTIFSQNCTVFHLLMLKDFFNYFIVAFYGVWQKQEAKIIEGAYKLEVLSFKSADQF